MSWWEGWENVGTVFGGWLLLGYALGSIPFGPFFAWVFGLGDLRTIGSGNVGATNVLRTGHKTAAFLTLLCDGIKGFVPVMLALPVQGILPLAVGWAAFLGHLFPVWLRFKGGKGVATGLGVLLALDVSVGGISVLVWMVTAGMTRYSSIASLASCGTVCVLLALSGQYTVLFATIPMIGMIVWRHLPNIRRILAGTETRIGI